MLAGPASARLLSPRDGRYSRRSDKYLKQIATYRVRRVRVETLERIARPFRLAHKLAPWAARRPLPPLQLDATLDSQNANRNETRFLDARLVRTADCSQTTRSSREFRFVQAEAVVLKQNESVDRYSTALSVGASGCASWATRTVTLRAIGIRESVPSQPLALARRPLSHDYNVSYSYGRTVESPKTLPCKAWTVLHLHDVRGSKCTCVKCSGHPWVTLSVPVVLGTVTCSESTVLANEATKLGAHELTRHSWPPARQQVCPFDDQRAYA